MPWPGTFHYLQNIFVKLLQAKISILCWFFCFVLFAFEGYPTLALNLWSSYLRHLSPKITSMDHHTWLQTLKLRNDILPIGSAKCHHLLYIHQHLAVFSYTLEIFKASTTYILIEHISWGSDKLNKLHEFRKSFNIRSFDSKACDFTVVCYSHEHFCFTCFSVYKQYYLFKWNLAI